MGKGKPGRMRAGKEFEVYLEARKNPEKPGEARQKMMHISAHHPLFML